VTAFSWTGAAVFVGALAYFLFCYSLRFSAVTPGAIAPAAVAWDTLLFSVFALHHSVFARERMRGWVARHVAPELERSVYVWIASILFIAVCALWRPVAGVAWRIDGPLGWVLVALQLAGVWVTIRSAVVIDVLDLAGVRMRKFESQIPNSKSQIGPRPLESAEGTEFKTTGPYGWVRHPIYAGWFLLVFAVGTMTMTRLVFAVVSSVYVLIAIPFEERSLRTTTGGAYDRYVRQVKRKLIPGIY
jgi:methanethiol S-methyltransferase